MRNAAAVERLLGTDPADAGCAEAMRVLHVYAELTAAIAANAATAGPANAATAANAAAVRLPGVAAHLAACGPCGADLRGLLAAIAAED
ncbi:MAG TPA: hypothetical protein VG164_03045 [Trebonia sp.]|jgi:hypothetical protein|nr:hypothetical protein [Trebonia sp.]